MPKSTIFLPDVNVWLALVSKRHTSNALAVRWFEGIGQASIVFCRITQMGLLRLLTNSHVMGPDIITQEKAWGVYAQIHQDQRIRFIGEPSGLEDHWRSLTQQAQPAVHAWTDAYLLAFAKVAQLTLVTFDQSFHTVTDPPVVLLG